MAAPARAQVDLLMGAGMPGAQARVIAASLDMPTLPLAGTSPVATIAMNAARDAEGEWHYMADGQAALICMPRDDPMYIANAIAGRAGDPVLEWVNVWEAAPIAPPGNVEIPYVSQNGDLLSCTMGSWTGAPTDYAYAWKDETTDLGAGGDTYTLTEADVGHSITCVVTATNALGSTEAPPSNAVLVEALPAADAEDTAAGGPE